jgi:hypothetical protein
VTTAVSLYEDADGASGYLRDDAEDSRREIGTTNENFTLQVVQDFDAGAIGEESAGQVATLSSASTSVDDRGLAFHATALIFRQGRIVGVVMIGRFDDEDVQEEATALARKLDERIQAVLRDEVEAEPAAQPEPTAEPEPTSETASEPSGGVWPSDVLDSFRYSGQTAVEVEGGLVLTAEGEFEAPDRLRCTISGTLGGVAIGKDELIVIGEDAWLDGGDGFEATSADDPDVVDDLDLCPGSPAYWEDFDAIQDTTTISGVSETINGVAATRYRMGEAVEALKAVGFLPSELEGVTMTTLDFWLAEDGGWPVALSIDISLDAAAAEEAFGMPVTEGSQQARIEIRVDITDANDEDIHVEPPGP